MDFGWIIKMKYKALIDQMSIEEKASFLSGKDFWTTMESKQHQIPSMFLADGPHGLRKQAAAADQLGLNESLKSTCYPTAVAMANTWNLDLAKEMATYLGKEAASLDVNIVLGPGTNIKRNPLCGRNFEYFSEDPFLAGKFSAAYIQGIQSQGISACLKHFAANNQEYRRLVIDSIVDERTLQEIYLTPFRIGIQEGNAKAIMSSYNRLNGIYTNENMHLMQEVLRKQWKYQGLVITDWGGSNDRVSGLIAGNELEMPTTAGETNQEIVDAIRNGSLDEEVLDDCLDRLLQVAYDTDSALKKAPKEYHIEEHHRMALKAAEEAIVLLKNVRNALPLGNAERVAIIGDFAKKPRYQGAGSSIVNPTKLDDTISSITDYDINYIGYEQGYHRYGKSNQRKLHKAIELAKKADTLLVYIGLDELSEVEGIDRSDMLLPNNQLELLDQLMELNKKIIIVLSSGSPVEMDFATRADAILHASLIGQAGAKAVLNIITGQINPSGKLSETYPYQYKDVPSYNTFPGKELTAEYREGLYVGYRYYDTMKIPVRYPFGYGLSYTTFEYSELQVSKTQLSFQIKNTGKMDGSEVAQCYIQANASKIYRPKKELKGFAKVFLKQGETKIVSIPLGPEAFAFYNTEEKQWQVEDLQYTILIGSSLQDIRLSQDLHVVGKQITPNFGPSDLPSYYSGDIKDVSTKEFERLLGREVPQSSYAFIKKNRMIIGYNTTVELLRYSTGFMGRLFSGAIRFAIWLLQRIGQRETANTLVMGMLHQPIRGISRMSGGIINWSQLNGLIEMFNGHFFCGLKSFLRAGKIKRREKKQQRQRKGEK